MIKDNIFINDLAHGKILEHIAEVKGVDIEAAKAILQSASFSEYVELIEKIVPPSGTPVGSATAPAQSTQNKKTPVWANKNSPLTPGMTVGVNSETGVSPMQVSQVDQAANGVKVKDPTTGKEQWLSKDDLADPTVQEENDDDLSRILELAGISEMSSGGAVSAGAIATAPASMGSVRKRTEESGSLKKEYTRKEPPKTIIGDTKPGQASGELSANLAASGKPSASRKNAGFKRT